MILLFTVQRKRHEIRLSTSNVSIMSVFITLSIKKNVLQFYKQQILITTQASKEVISKYYKIRMHVDAC